MRPALLFASEVESVSDLRRNHPWIVEVEATDGDAVVLKNPMVGHIHSANCE